MVVYGEGVPAYQLTRNRSSEEQRTTQLARQRIQILLSVPSLLTRSNTPVGQRPGEFKALSNMKKLDLGHEKITLQFFE